MVFAHKLKAMRALRKITQAQLAEAARIPLPWIKHLEASNTLPTRNMQCRLRQALDWGIAEDRALAGY